MKLFGLGLAKSTVFRFIVVAVSMSFTVGSLLSPALADNTATKDNVTIADKGNYYAVVLNLENGATHRQVGEEYGKKILQVLPNYEAILDSYIAEETEHNWLIYHALLHRIKEIRKNLPQEYCDEIEGIASAFSGGNKNVPGDGKVSTDELYMLNLLADVARITQCSAVGVYGASSSTSDTIVGRNLDWPDGKDNQLSKLQAVVEIEDGDKSIITIACLGYQGAVTAISKSHLFAAILDSGSCTKYMVNKKRSYVMDLRTAMENGKNLSDVVNFMSDPEKHYTYNHLIFLADPKVSEVLENNFSGCCGSPHRTIRTADSQLKDNLGWTIPDAVGVVNCFALKDNIDNHIDCMSLAKAKKHGKDTAFVPVDVNTPRWKAMQAQLKEHGPRLDMQGMEQVLSEHHGAGPGRMRLGDLYNNFTVQSIVFEPSNFALKVFFHPREGGLPNNPSFIDVPVKF